MRFFLYLWLVADRLLILMAQFGFWIYFLGHFLILFLLLGLILEFWCFRSLTLVNRLGQFEIFTRFFWNFQGSLCFDLKDTIFKSIIPLRVNSNFVRFLRPIYKLAIFNDFNYCMNTKSNKIQFHLLKLWKIFKFVIW